MTLIVTAPFSVAASAPVPTPGGSEGVMFAGRDPSVAGAAGAHDVNFYYDNVTENTNISTSIQSPTRTSATGFGNTLVAIVATGYTEVAYSASTSKYTYATDSVISATSTTAGKHLAASFSNTNVGIVAGGNPNGEVVNEYTYVGDSVIAKTSLSGRIRAPGAFGLATVGYLFGGNDLDATVTDTIRKYTYASGATVDIAAVTSLTYEYWMGSNNDIEGITQSNGVLHKFVFASETWAGVTSSTHIGTTTTSIQQAPAMGFSDSVVWHGLAGETTKYINAANTTEIVGNLTAITSYAGASASTGHGGLV